MTREEKVAEILLALDDNNKLRALLRMLIKQAVTNVPDDQLDMVYSVLYPPEEV